MNSAAGALNTTAYTACLLTIMACQDYALTYHMYINLKQYNHV